MSSPFDLFKDKNKTIKENLRAAADVMMLKLAVANNFAGKILLGAAIKKEFQALGPRIKAGDLSLKPMGVTVVDVKIADLSKKLTSLSKQDVRNFIEDKLSTAQDPVAAKEKMTKAAQKIKDINEDEYAFLAKLFVSLLPPKIDQLHTEIALEGGTPDQRAREFYRMSIDERTAQAIALAKKAPVDELTDVVYDTLQKMTPQKLTDVLHATWSRLNEDQAVAFVRSFFVFSEDLFSTVKKTNTIAVKDPGKQNDFAAATRVVLTAVEEAIITANVLPDAAKLQTIRAKMAEKPPINNKKNDKNPGGIKPK